MNMSISHFINESERTRKITIELCDETIEREFGVRVSERYTYIERADRGESKRIGKPDMMTYTNI